jgi:predicted metal-dependent hydrolase
MQLRLPWATPARTVPVRRREVIIDGQTFPVVILRHRWARRYILRVLPDQRLRLTVPRGASIGDGLAFVATQTDWIAAEWSRQVRRGTWVDGTEVWYRGRRVAIELDDRSVTLGAERIDRPIAGAPRDVRTLVARHLRDMAAGELPSRCRDLGLPFGLAPTRITVRDQRSRWGACSSRGSVTLNWRLVQMPPDVCDYVMLHELAHLDHHNHSRRFWKRVAEICPAWREAERWLRRHGRELL